MPPALELMGPSGASLMQGEEEERLAPIRTAAIEARDTELADATAYVKVDDDGEVEDATGSKERIPISSLPPLAGRHQEYFLEPLCGIGFVLGACAFFVSLVQGVWATAKDKDSWVLFIAGHLIYVEVIIAVLCLLFLILGQASVIKRSAKTCFPIPPEVEERLKQESPDLSGLANIAGPAGSETLGTYCVRCLVWRPPRNDNHHCSTCQRCVTHFDHHCGVFGRCIVGGNMPCFSALIALLPIAFVTLMAVMVSSEPAHHHHPRHHPAVPLHPT